MHELGIVVHISKTLEELAQENNISNNPLNTQEQFRLLFLSAKSLYEYL